MAAFFLCTCGPGQAKIKTGEQIHLTTPASGNKMVLRTSFLPVCYKGRMSGNAGVVAFMLRDLSKQSLFLALSVLIGAFGIGAASAADPAIKGPELSLTDLNILENRFFNHAYAHDPVEKRLERIECLVFGSTKSGDNKQRLARLMETVNTRSQQPLSQDKNLSISKSATGKGDSAASKPPASSTQYPILNTLEWRALKKTYQSQSLDQRLDRLESQLFGQPAQSMAYIDRVDRIKKTLGIGLEGPQSTAEIGMGPAPKARPRGEAGGDLDGFMPPALSERQGPGIMPVNPLGNSPFGVNPLGRNPLGMSPFGGIDPFGDGLMDTMRQMMKQLQGREFADLGPGTWVWDPKTRTYVDINSGKRVGQDGKPRGIAPGGADKGELQIRDLPGYADPNSI